MNKVVLTTQQIFDAYDAHGEDFVVIDLASTRKYKTFSQYISINIKLADGNVVPVRYWKLSDEGIVLASKIRAPEQRKFESIRLGFALYNEDGSENENCKALKIICESVENKLTDMKTKNIITDNEKAPRKQPDGTFKPFHLISTKIVSPMQVTAMDKELDDIVDLENPRFWLSLPKKRFFKPNEQYVSTHFEDKYYVDDDNTPDMERPVMTHTYAPVFYNVDEWQHHPRTGKKVFKKLGAVDDDGEVVLDNTNIQNFLTKGSAIMGNLQFEIVVSGRQCKLEISLNGNCYVKHADVNDDEYNNVDEDAVSAFSNKYAKISSETTMPDIEDVDEGECDM